MYISRVKAKGNFYFYAYVYDSSSEHAKRTVYSLGRQEKALELLNDWNTHSNIPHELMEYGLDVQKIPSWINNIQDFSRQQQALLTS